MDEEKQAWRFTPEILKDPRKTESTFIALAVKIEQIPTGLKNLANLNRLGVNFNNVTSVKRIAKEILTMTWYSRRESNPNLLRVKQLY